MKAPMSKPAGLRTPLARVRGLGSAKAGTEHFFRQRLTAVANIPLVIAFIVILISVIGRNQAAAVQILGSPLVAIVMLLFIVSVTYHMRIGMQVIIEDYVHGDGFKLALIVAVRFIAIFFGLPLDVRHVTLSTGQVTAAFAMLGGEHLWQLSTLWIVIGILGTGLLNILVSFALALWVAIRARNVRGPELRSFYRALLNRLIKSPLSFVLPVGVVQSPASASH